MNGRPDTLARASVLRHRGAEIQLLLAQHKPWQRHTKQSARCKPFHQGRGSKEGVKGQERD